MVKNARVENARVENAGVENAGADSKGAGVGKPYGKPNRHYALRDP